MIEASEQKINLYPQTHGISNPIIGCIPNDGTFRIQDMCLLNWWYRPVSILRLAWEISHISKDSIPSHHSSRPVHDQSAAIDNHPLVHIHTQWQSLIRRNPRFRIAAYVFFTLRSTNCFVKSNMVGFVEVTNRNPLVGIASSICRHAALWIKPKCF